MERNLLKGLSMAVIVCGMMTTATLSSCSSNDEEEQQMVNLKPVELKINAGISTRAADALWAKGDQIGVFCMNGTTAEYSNKIYTTADGDGSFTANDETQTIMLPYDDSQRTIAAYYPYTADAVSGTYSINLSNQTNQEAIDLLVAEPAAGISKTNAVASLIFRHKLVKMELTITPGEGISQDQLSKMTVTLSNQLTTGTCDVINNGDVTTSGNASTVTLLTSSDGTSSEAILMPAASTRDMTLTFNIPDVGVYTWNVSNAEKSQLFLAGNKYKYGITINQTSLEITGTIEDWTAGNGTDGESGNAIQI